MVFGATWTVFHWKWVAPFSRNVQLAILYENCNRWHDLHFSIKKMQLALVANNSCILSTRYSISPGRGTYKSSQKEFLGCFVTIAVPAQAEGLVCPNSAQIKDAWEDRLRKKKQRQTREANDSDGQPCDHAGRWFVDWENINSQSTDT
jgi:hypothetical protein